MVAIKTPEEIKILAEGGKKLAFVLSEIASRTKDGVSAAELDLYARELIKKAGGKPSFLGYKPRGVKDAYPAALCVSINDEIVHAIPYEYKIICNGDIVGLDLGMEYKNLFTDTAVTVGVGKIGSDARYLLDVTRKCLNVGIEAIRPGATLGDYGCVVETLAEKAGFGVIKNLVGHGVGYAVHEDPDIPNWGDRRTGMEFKEGMVLALEPMLCFGEPDIILDEDGWGWKTKSGSLSAQFEHTIVVEKGGCRILTK
jgi:methionyl aminopeptidase